MNKYHNPWYTQKLNNQSNKQHKIEKSPFVMKKKNTIWAT